MINILIVDDVRFIRLGIITTLKGETDLEFHEAATVEQAVKVLEKNNVDLILLDLDLGNNIDLNPDKKDGLDLIRHMRDSHMTIPHVVILSGTVNENKIMEAYKLGIKEVISKPYTSKALTDIVSKIKLEKMQNAAAY